MTPSRAPPRACSATRTSAADPRRAPRTAPAPLAERSGGSTWWGRHRHAPTGTEPGEEQVDEDLCDLGGDPTQYSAQEDLFICGPTAAGAQACALEDGTVQCIVDPEGERAIEFGSPTASEP